MKDKVKTLGYTDMGTNIRMYDPKSMVDVEGSENLSVIFGFKFPSKIT